MKENRKHIDKMTKDELRFELDNLRDEYARLKVKSDIIKLLDRFVTASELEKVKEYAEKIYKQEVVKNWGFFYGMRDNIHDMADNLAERQNIEELQYFATFMYGVLLNKEPQAIEGLNATNKTMQKMLLEHLTSEKAVQL